MSTVSKHEDVPIVSRVSEEATAFDNPKIGHRTKVAAGPGGVLHAMTHAIPARGLLP